MKRFKIAAGIICILAVASAFTTKANSSKFLTVWYNNGTSCVSSTQPFDQAGCAVKAGTNCSITITGGAQESPVFDSQSHCNGGTAGIYNFSN